MQSVDVDRAFLESSLTELPEFVLSKEIYWPIGIQPNRIFASNLPQLSIGNIRLASARLVAGKDSGKDAQLISAIDQVFTQWRSNWAKKAALEYSSRLNLWKDRLAELISDPSQAIYRYEIRLRVILDLLQDDLLLEPSQTQVDLLAGLDARLQASTILSEFIWDPDIQDGFPKERFWYLYRSLKLSV
ncbi:MAG TPA: hypothetical protein VN452_06385 [Longilinea sp.]|nr:hypothetical protein [Longilinea sp.]